MVDRVVAVIADRIGGPEAVEQLHATANGSQVEPRLVAAPVEATRSATRWVTSTSQSARRPRTSKRRWPGSAMAVSSCADGRRPRPDPGGAGRPARGARGRGRLLRAHQVRRALVRGRSGGARERDDRAASAVVKLESVPPQEPPRTHVVDVESSPAGIVDQRLSTTSARPTSPGSRARTSSG